MGIEDRIHIVKLIDIYGMLLTESQLEIMRDYYLCDLSFSEIAENRNISRSAISDSINKSIAKLEDYEKKLHIIKDNLNRKEIIESIKDKIDEETYKRLLDLIK